MMIKQFWLFFIFFFLTSKNIAQNITMSKQMSTFIIEAPQLHTQKKIWVYLPKNYATSLKKFPVLYMHDAQNLFDAKTAYAGEWNIDEKLDSLNAEIIVIGIEHGNEKRITELTHYKNQKYGGGNADNYLDFIVNTLKPKIDNTYQTKSNRKNTLIMGSSLGGLVSYYAILKYPNVFGKAGIFSPSFWFSDQIYSDTEKTKDIKTKIYLLCGANEGDDMVQNMQKMALLLQPKIKRKSQLTSKVIKGGQHNEKLWRENFTNALLWLGY
ncbi:Endo-1,4-beta-xylanase/feruloyl esterase [Flavobacterium sp. PL0002]|nr:Endo-1,4-beta-xylanase/feruloyl esterase [Flavobacterium sp. PL002]